MTAIEYHPYGTTSYQVGRSGAEVSLKRYRYTGKERDEETGLSYHGARYYVPWLGRWISCDPIGLRDGLNLYQYVQSNPIRLADPSGTEGSPLFREAFKDPFKFQPSFSSLTSGQRVNFQNGQATVNYDFGILPKSPSEIRMSPPTMDFGDSPSAAPTDAKQADQNRTAVNKRLEQIADDLLGEKGLDPTKISQTERENNLDVIEVCARALTDDKIQDLENTGNSARDRVHTLLDATREGKTGALPTGHRGGVLVPNGKVSGTQGFRTEMKDPAPDNSQLGHFLTAVDIGRFAKREADSLLQPGLRGELAPHIVMAMIGHEKAKTAEEVGAGRSWWNASIGDLRNFHLAEGALGSEDEIDIKSAQKNLDHIKVGNEQIGAHRQDLVASLVGYRFGVSAEAGKFGSREQAAGWIRLNVGGHTRRGTLWFP